MTGAIAGQAPPAGRLAVFLVAAEESGDRLGAALMDALARQHSGALSFAGVGGGAMAAAGLESLFPIEELTIIGLASIPRRLAMILRRIRQTAAAIIAARPDVLVIIDSPDFTHRVARRVRAAAPSIPIVDYVSPSVWAWRPGRARAMRAYVDHVLAILPFEPAVHRKLGGPPTTYVGHPLAEQVKALRPDAAEVSRRQADPPIVLVLPGSRPAEIRRLLGPFGAALELVRHRAGNIELMLPSIAAVLQEVRNATVDWPVAPRVIVDPEEKLRAFRIARAALAASGTVTLELALAAVPTVAAYRVAGWEAAIARRLIRVPSVILANLVLGENIVPELLQDACVPERLAAALFPLLCDGPERRRQLEAFARLDQIMEIATAQPSRRAAEIVLAAARRELR
ncbi:MAG: lipid-A-disaccharide synthase [Alphaproteobacteria bacterium]|nr:MAG: lipid-A-disaccharide synthase [Alphaproteobacteria bacterium]